MKNIPLLAAIACFALFAADSLAQQNPKLSDAEVAHAAVTANQIDIDFAAIAKSKSSNIDILRFAETMANDHNAVIAQAVALAKKLGVTPVSNDVSKKLTADAKETTTSKKDFDKVYIDNEVSYHKAVISAVEGLLIPETENSELKELLQNVVPSLKVHLQHAEMVQKMFSGK
jgi:putative membrane protein